MISFKLFISLIKHIKSTNTVKEYMFYTVLYNKKIDDTEI